MTNVDISITDIGAILSNFDAFAELVDMSLEETNVSEARPNLEKLAGIFSQVSPDHVYIADPDVDDAIRAALFHSRDTKKINYDDLCGGLYLVSESIQLDEMQRVNRFLYDLGLAIYANAVVEEPNFYRT